MIHPYSSPFHIKHRAAKLLFDGPVVVEEKIDGCVTLDTPVLTSDLRWVPAGELVVGQELIGLEIKRGRLRLAPSTVTHATPIDLPCVRVETDKGTVVVSENHPFWHRHVTSNNPSKWTEAKDLPVGTSIPYIPVWETDKSWEAGYLSGQFDGEGSLVRAGSARVLSYYQRVSDSQRFVRETILSKGYTLREDYRQRKPEYSEMWTGIIAGGWGEVLRFLGEMRPPRLMEKARRTWDGGAMNGLDKARVLSVTSVGIRTVMGLSTSTETYWAGGLASHNSQFSFGLYFDGEQFTLHCRSKGKLLDMDAPEKMFALAVAKAKELTGELTPEWTYRGEFLQKTKHNTLAYDRVPAGNIILFDIDRGDQDYLTVDEKRTEAGRLGLELVPVLYEGVIESADQFRALLPEKSILGGACEGIVAKNYAQFAPDKKILMGKYVTEAFKEIHGGEWKKNNPAPANIIDTLVQRYKTPARWQKAVQHLKEAGALTDSPKDIGLLLPEVVADIEKECKDEILEQLWAWSWKKVQRGVTAGLPQWYKEQLLNEAFNSDTESDDGDEAADPA